ncbi:MAG TPA: type II toxin-antitoxin system VapC family toxin [Thermodesulfobacteriota bacterium]|nr:type II toxin-antitoxin system VapC family toxin [Thermodesulfobacteriota bacterium]
MMNKPSLYLESTIISYLAAYPSRDLIVAAHQQITHEWWDQVRPKFNNYISQAVLDEISIGDPDAASRRRALAAGLPILALTEEVELLAEEYVSKLGLPRGAQLDAVHLACAVFYEVDYLLTWNCAHLANGLVIKRLQRVNAALGRSTPVIATPEELLTSPGGG